MDGYIQLLLKIFGIEEPRKCRECGIFIEKSKDGHNLCLGCFRIANCAWQHKPHPRAGSRRVIALRTFPIPQLCQVADCRTIGIRHHPDYDKPREIIWLCNSHHQLLHRGYSLDTCAKIKVEWEV